jgi:hypothetical protein
VGWHHKKCVDLDEDFSAVYWLCDRCLKKWRGIELSKMESEEISGKIREASDARIQQTKTLFRPRLGCTRLAETRQSPAFS